MFSKVKKAFQDERDYQSLIGLENTMTVDGMNGFIFCNRFGKLHNPAGINRVIKRIVTDYNTQEFIRAKKKSREPVILPKFSSHIARHTFCSRLCENETNVKLIQQIMDHKDIRTTLDIYAEISESRKKEIDEENVL